MMRAQVGFWTLEQVPGVYKFLQGHVPWMRVLEFSEYTGLTARRKRVIAASAPLDLVALTPSEMEKVFVPPEAVLRKRKDRPYNLGDGPVKIRNGFGAETGADRAAFTVTSNPLACFPCRHSDGTTGWKRSLRPDTQDVIISYSDHNLKHVLAKNFYLDSNGRIPSDVLLEVRKQQEKLGLPVSK